MGSLPLLRRGEGNTLIVLAAARRKAGGSFFGFRTPQGPGAVPVRFTLPEYVRRPGRHWNLFCSRLPCGGRFPFYGGGEESPAPFSPLLDVLLAEIVQHPEPHFFRCCQRILVNAVRVHNGTHPLFRLQPETGHAVVPAVDRPAVLLILRRQSITPV